ncbi:hypothetical protein ACLMJK_001757 [Lecanora helva]
MPDIDSLPPPYSPPRVNGSDRRHSPSSRASSVSLNAAATINAGIQNEDSRRASLPPTRDRGPLGQGDRRRTSAVLSSYDPALPGPGELQTGDLRNPNVDQPSPRMSPINRTASPYGIGAMSPSFPPRYRERTPSLGELHQQLEQEHEAQVIRLLGVIRQAQDDLQNLREQAAPSSRMDLPGTGEITPPIERSAPGLYASPHPLSSNPPSGNVGPRPNSPAVRGSFELSRRSSHRSRTPSRAVSPSLRNPSTSMYAPNDDFFSGGRTQTLMDENSYYQAETQNLTRENQMLRQRIRELERQMSEGNSTATSSPIIPSNLSGPPIEAAAPDGTLNDNGEKED